MGQPDRSAHKNSIEALGELFSDPRIRSHAHFRYRIDGPAETEKTLDAVFKEASCPHSKGRSPITCALTDRDAARTMSWMRSASGSQQEGELHTGRRLARGSILGHERSGCRAR